MLALPETEPAQAEWQDAGSVDHVFTHFSLTMKLLCAEVGQRPEIMGDSLWWPAETIGEAGLPTLFAKLAGRGLAWRQKEMEPAPVRQGILV
jgi:A/G-specific adenine glycosylase